MNFKKILGFEEFQQAPEIINFLSELNTDQNYSVQNCQLIERNKKYYLWLISSDTHVFIVRDNGHKLKTLLKRRKTDFHYKLFDRKIFIENTTTPLPFDTTITGSVEEFKENLATMTGSRSN